MKSNIILIGFMGTGKTSIGKILATKLGCAFVDLDHKIESDHKMKIPEIFKKFGEDHFRKLEKQAVK
ncbi:MAG: AAA family ATPase, partial [Selenomonadaceae bacterium]|nr:AAA family ATPase [Selenomonadaceae bacterium]